MVSRAIHARKVLLKEKRLSEVMFYCFISKAVRIAEGRQNYRVIFEDVVFLVKELKKIRNDNIEEVVIKMGLIV